MEIPNGTYNSGSIDITFVEAFLNAPSKKRGGPRISIRDIVIKRRRIVKLRELLEI